MQIPNAAQSVNQIVSDMHQIAKSHAPVSIGLGQVLTEPPELTIAWNGIVLEKEQLYIDFFLLKNYKRSARGNKQIKFPEMTGNIETHSETEEGGSGDAEYESHYHDIDDDFTETEVEGKGKYIAASVFTDYGLEAGDLVAILPIEGAQKFIVLSKLIYLPLYREDEKPDGEFTGDIDEGD